DNSVENYTDTFVRDLSSDTLSDAGFKSDWENGERPDHPGWDAPAPTKQACRSVCDYKSVSVYVSVDTIRLARETTRQINPALVAPRTHYCIFKLAPNSG